jgi:hypothetical protein
VAGATAAAAIGLAASLPGGAGSAPAYAVEHNDDGSLTVTFDEVSGLGGPDREAMMEDLAVSFTSIGVTVVDRPTEALVCGTFTYRPLAAEPPYEMPPAPGAPDDGELGPERVTTVMFLLPETGTSWGSGTFVVRPGDTAVLDVDGVGNAALAVFDVPCEPAGD